MWKCTGRFRSEHTSHQRVPFAIGEVGGTGLVGVRRHVHAAEPEVGDTLGLVHTLLDAPPGEEGHGEEAVPRPLLQLGHRVVVDLDAQAAEDRVGHVVGEVLAAEADRVGVEHLRVHAALVHHLEANLGVPRRGVDPFDRVPDALLERVLVPVVVEHAAAAGWAQHHVAVDDPRRHALDLDHSWHPVLVSGRCARREQIVTLRHMGVGVDDAHFVGQLRHVTYLPGSRRLDVRLRCAKLPPCRRCPCSSPRCSTSWWRSRRPSP